MKQPITRTVYRSPDGRVEVQRTGREYDLFLDGEYVGCFASQAAAETEAGVWLHEQAERLSVYQRAA